MSDYNTFDTKIQCDEFSPEVSEAEQAEVMAMLAAEAEAMDGFGTWAEETERAAIIEQARFDAEQETAKDWLNGYTAPTGPKLNGFDI